MTPEITPDRPIIFALCILAAVVVDVVTYWLVSDPKKPAYYPNLPLWGIGFLAGLCINFLGMLGAVIAEAKTAFSNPPSGSYALAQNLVFIIVPALLLGVTIWAVAKLGHRE